VVNVAGGLFTAGPFLEQPPDAIDRELAANLLTVVHVCRAAIPALLAREQGSGAIVNFASIAALRGIEGMAYYTAAKSAVAGLTRALAREFGPRGIRVNAVAPITVRTPENVAQLGPGTVMVDLADLVATVRFLASPAARGVNGQIVAIAPRGG
jgi:3-oxoacyl-[acyl-carrier protein] reductase